MDFQIQNALDTYRERLAEAERNYEIHQALYEERRGRDISLRILRFTGRLLVGLGKTLQRWGATGTDTALPLTR